ncbi:MAG: type II toxin-antitoxin system RelE/ParE family toxin [Myxococcota bacterium]
MRRLRWTRRAREDLASIRAFITEESPNYAALVVGRIVAAADRLERFPQSGRIVPEIAYPHVREVIYRPYRIVYRLVGTDELHILTVHHSARGLPEVP